MIITEFNKFMKSYIKEAKTPKYEFGIVKVDLGIKDWKKLTDSINKDDLYEPDPSFGIEESPHLTLLYGIQKGVSIEEVIKCFENIKGQIKIESNGISIFENPDFDVIKLDVKKTKILIEIHNSLLKLPNSFEFSYNPHITIAYIKGGLGKKYIDPDYNLTINNITEIKYSTPTGDRYRFRI